MAEHDDPLAGSISIEAALTETGVKASAKSRFLVALDRLLGGVVDIPAAYVDGKAKLRRLENEIALNARREAAEINLRATSEIQRLEQEAVVAAQREAVRRRLNKQGAVLEALEDLRQSPPEHDASEPMDADWLNVFGDYAERASSDRLRNLWGKILAGEIRQARSFSLTTLRILSELDQQTAALFQSIVPRIYGEQFVVLDKEHRGTFFIDLNTLEELGFVQDASGTMSITLRFDENGDYKVVSGERILMIKGPSNNGFPVPVAKVTRSATEILKLLPQDDGNHVLRKLAEHASDMATSIEISTVVAQHPDGTYTYRSPAEKIK